MPDTGLIERIKYPVDCRIDSGVEEGTVITSKYDSMLAKLIFHGETRQEAINKSIMGLKETKVY